MAGRDDLGYFRDLLNAVLEACADAVIMADLDGVIMMFNEDGEAIFRIDALDALGKDLFAMLFPEDDVAEVKAALEAADYVRDRRSRISLAGTGEEVLLKVTILKTARAPERGRALMALVCDVTADERRRGGGPSA